MKQWQIAERIDTKSVAPKDILSLLLVNRGLTDPKAVAAFLNPKKPADLTAADVGIDRRSLTAALRRIRQAIDRKQSIVVYADYDADGISAGTVMWETLYKLGARVMPYIPHRVDEGYGLSEKGLDAVKQEHDPALIITVDHGITAWEKVAYARKLGMDVIITDHHTKPDRLPDTTIVHTTELCGAGVAWFVAKELVQEIGQGQRTVTDLLAVAAIGTIADMVPLVGANRSIAKYGIAQMNRTNRVGVKALIVQAGLTQGAIGPYEISHVLAPRINAMGRLVHAMDAMRLLCTGDVSKAKDLADLLGETNRERQQLTMDATTHALNGIGGKSEKKLLFISHESYNQGIIGLVAGRLVEEYYRPAIVVTRGEEISKASARSVRGFNIVDAIRSAADLLIDVGGHPMAAGFTVETKNLEKLRKRLEDLAEKSLTGDMLTRSLSVDLVLPLAAATEKLWLALRDLEPFGFGNPAPVFASEGVEILSLRTVGTDGRHLKLKVADTSRVPFDAIAFRMGDLAGKLKPGDRVDLAYALDMNFWNGSSKLQLKVKDIRY